MAYYKPDKSRREAPYGSARSTAVVFIDTQNYNCHRDGNIYKSLSKDEQDSEDVNFFFSGVDAAIPQWQTLLQACRDANVEVLWTVIQSLTHNGRDRGLDYKISGFHVPPGSWDAEVLSSIAPLDTEIVLPKSTSSVFNSTVLHYILGNLGVKQLILCGCVTDQCVAHAVMDACDLGYLVTLVTDACVTYSEERQRASLSGVSGYCRQRTTAEVVEELQGLTKDL